MTADTVSIHGKVNAIFRGMDTLVKAGANLILKGAQTFINP
jgi:type VI secretion system secreted protein VgrG